MSVLLDIDGCLLDWSGSKGNDDFDDWQRPDVRLFNYYSPSQLNLISKSFDDIQWHTTWIENNMCNELWHNVTGWGPYPIFIDQLQDAAEKHSEGEDFYPIAPNRSFGGRSGLGFSSGLIDPEIDATLYNADWWKLNGVALALHEGLLPGKVLWIDDDLAGTFKSVSKVLAHYDATERFRFIIPSAVLRKADIIEGAEWLAKP